MAHAQTSDIDLAKMMSDSESIIRTSISPMFLITFKRQGYVVQQPINTLDNALRYNDEGPLSIPEQSTKPAPDSLS